MLAEEIFSIFRSGTVTFDGPITIINNSNDPALTLKAFNFSNDASIVIKRAGQDDIVIGQPDNSAQANDRPVVVRVPSDLLIIRANNQTKVYGDTFTWLGNEFTLTWVPHTGLDSVDGVTFNSPGSVATANVGTYPIGLGDAHGFGLSSFDIKYLQGTMTVTKATPTIVWADPADIVQGTALSGTQLNAEAVHPITGLWIAGTFVYTPGSGTVLSAGNGQALQVDFTPDDLVNYNTATATVHINVTAAAFAFVQAKGATNFPGDVTVAVSLDSNVTIGNIIVACFKNPWNRTITVTDSQLNTYTQVGTTINADNQIAIQVWQTIATATGALTVTITDPFVGVHSLGVLEYSGQHASPIDATGSDHIDGAFHDKTRATGAVVVGASSGVLIGAFAEDADESDGSGYTSSGNAIRAQVGLNNTGWFMVVDLMSPTAGSQSLAADAGYPGVRFVYTANFGVSIKKA